MTKHSMNAMPLSPELHAFAVMLGKKLNKFEPDSFVAAEYDEIAEYRLSQRMGLPTDSTAFRAVWDTIMEVSSGMIEDDPVETLSNWTVPTETELAGLPKRTWRVAVLGTRGQTIRNVLVEARTSGEALRLVEAMNLPGAHGYAYTRGDDVNTLLVMECRLTWDETVARDLAERLGVDYDGLPPLCRDSGTE